jgi:hypothetical protein
MNGEGPKKTSHLYLIHSMARTPHPSGHFAYARVEHKPDQTNYHDCILLRDVTFDTMVEHAPDVACFVTFHRDDICVNGARIELIAQQGHQLAGWNGNELVMDGPCATGD